jgi:hypothetical protein
VVGQGGLAHIGATGDGNNSGFSIHIFILPGKIQNG